MKSIYKSIGLHEVDQKDILIARNLLTPPALLLDKKIVPDPGSLLDFCTLINAIMLHDRLVTFRAKCPDEILDLTLYRYLKDILVELDTSSIDRNELTIQYTNPIVGKKATHEELKKTLGENYSFSEYIKDDKFVPDGNYEIKEQRKKYIEEIIANKTSKFSLKKSRAKDLQSYRLRTLGYMAIANKTAVPFLPDSMRIPTIREFNYKLIEYARTTLNNQIHHNVREKMGQSTSITVTLPSAVSYFINEYASSSNLEQTFNNMRSQFKPYRKRLIDLENRWNKAQGENDIEEKNKVVKDIKELAEFPGETTIYKGEIILEMVSIILQPVLSSLAGIPSGGGLPSEIIATGNSAINFFRQKKRNDLIRGKKPAHPFRKVFEFITGKKETAVIRDQRNQLQKAFGKALEVDEIMRFKNLTNSLDRLLSKNDQGFQ